MTRKQHIGVYDEIYTPDYAINFLLDFLDERDLYKYSFKEPIWEPTADSDNIYNAIRNRGKEVISTNIDQFDFLNDNPNLFIVGHHHKKLTINNVIGSIITNPPYSLKKEFISKCYEYNKSFALLLPTEHIGTLFANKLYSEKGINILIPSRRIDFTGKGSPHTHTSWIFWSPTFSENELNRIYFRELHRR